MKPAQHRCAKPRGPALRRGFGFETGTLKGLILLASVVSGERADNDRRQAFACHGPILEFGHIVLDGAPDHAKVDVKIIVDRLVAHGPHLQPRYFGMRFYEFWRLLLNLLAASPVISMQRITAAWVLIAFE
jgi:hypothetical protein